MRFLLVITFSLISVFTYAEDFIDFNYYNHCLNNIIFFSDTNNQTKNDSVIYKFWEFGDGATSSGNNPIYAYDKEGNYNVTLTLKTMSGKELKVSKTISIATPPLAYFYPEEICYDQINFSNLTLDKSRIDQSIWDFGDGNNSFHNNPTHEFNKQGKYKVSLMVVNELGCWDSTSKTLQIINIESKQHPIYEINVKNNLISTIKKLKNDSTLEISDFEIQSSTKTDFSTSQKVLIKSCQDTLELMFYPLKDIIKKLGTNSSLINRIQSITIKDSNNNVIIGEKEPLSASFYDKWVAESHSKNKGILKYNITYITKDNLKINQEGIFTF